MDYKNKKILLIAKSTHLIEQFVTFANYHQLNYIIAAELNTALQKLEEIRPQTVIVEQSRDFLAADPIATRFSELLMFQDALIYMISSDQLTEFERLRFQSLGFNIILEASSLSDLYAHLSPTDAAKKVA